MNNNNQNKARFFAQYLENVMCKIIIENEAIPRVMLCSPTQVEWVKYNCAPRMIEKNGDGQYVRKIARTIQASHLILTPLRYLAENDAIQCMEIAGMINSEKYGFITKLSPPQKIVDAINEIKIWRLDVADFLRSRGYALPYLNLSVEQLIEYGWIVLVK